MEARPRLFWDSSAIIDAILARDDSPYYDLFDLGEAGLADMRVSPEVMRECEAILRQYSDDLVALLAVALHEANFATTPSPAQETVDYCQSLTGYRNDARILAAAEECLADILVTHDKAHFLGNPLLGPPETRCRAKSAEATLKWLLERLSTEPDEIEDTSSDLG